MVQSPLIAEAFRAICLDVSTLTSLQETVRDALRSDGHSGVLVGVSGGSTIDAPLAMTAETLGEGLAGRGAAVMSGGLDGVMEAASRGAKRADGVTIGLLPGSDPASANPHVDVPVATGWLEGRNFLLGLLSDGLVAVNGGYGTLSEVALARKLGRPVVGLHTADWGLPDVIHTEDPDDATDRLWAQLEVDGS